MWQWEGALVAAPRRALRATATAGALYWGLATSRDVQQLRPLVEQLKAGRIGQEEAWGLDKA